MHHNLMFMIDQRKGCKSKQDMRLIIRRLIIE
jgi:hypothetical protein